MRNLQSATIEQIANHIYDNASINDIKWPQKLNATAYSIKKKILFLIKKASKSALINNNQIQCDQAGHEDDWIYTLIEIVPERTQISIEMLVQLFKVIGGSGTIPEIVSSLISLDEFPYTPDQRQNVLEQVRRLLRPDALASTEIKAIRQYERGRKKGLWNYGLESETKAIKNTAAVVEITEIAGAAGQVVETIEPLRDVLSFLKPERDKPRSENIPSQKRGPGTFDRNNVEAAGFDALNEDEQDRYLEYWSIAKRLNKLARMTAVAVDHAVSIYDERHGAIHPDNLQIIEHRLNSIKSRHSSERLTIDQQAEHIRKTLHNARKGNVMNKFEIKIMERCISCLELIY